MCVREREKEYLQASISDFTNFSGVEDLPLLQMESLIESPCSLRRCKIHKAVSHIAFVTVVACQTGKTLNDSIEITKSISMI